MSHILDVVMPFWIYLFTPLGAVIATVLVASVIGLTWWLIRRFYGKKK